MTTGNQNDPRPRRLSSRLICFEAAFRSGGTDRPELIVGVTQPWEKRVAFMPPPRF